MSDSVARIHTDGAARGNPGPAAWAYVIERPGSRPIEAAGVIGKATNNVAEYTALIHALDHAARLHLRAIAIFSDSELMVRQLNGEYAVKSPELRPLYEAARERLARFAEARIEHVRRADNRRADALCNAALDADRPAKQSRPDASPRATAPRRKKSAGHRADVDARVLECLRAAAQAWAASGGNEPPAELVWEQIRSVLEEANALR